MTAGRPPALAVRLLKRFAASKGTDALTGDLVEALVLDTFATRTPLARVTVG